MKKKIHSSKIAIISGFDPEGNKGLLRDFQAISRSNLEVSSAITCLVSQPEKGSFHKSDLNPKDFQKLLDSLLPLNQFRVIKIGALGNEKTINVLGETLKKSLKKPYIILDPIIESSTGKKLLSIKSLHVLKNDLLPLVDLITPNVFELEKISGRKIQSMESFDEICKEIYHQYSTKVLVTGYVSHNRVGDFYFNGKTGSWLWRKKLIYKNKSELPIRGTGCYYASLIARNIALGHHEFEAIKKAKRDMNTWLKRELYRNEF